jgi:hypothetical protein
MKNVLFLLVFSALGHCSLAQFEFKYDSTEQRNQRDINAIDALYQVSKKGDFQLLFWMLPGQLDRRTLLVLTSNNNQWQARYFERQKENGNLTWKEQPVSQHGLETLWKGLLENDVLHVKSSGEIKDLSFHPVEGGTLYFFELLDKKGKRAYYYHCPKHQQQYNNHKELSRIINMIQLLNNFTQEKQKPIC